ncbi:hypothetical protein [Acidovorax sp.]|uniref:hypothetical protein n=1 Tax=Acidovorax sp. TaxID=1872122 RepID=UPI00391FC2E0
MKLPHRLLRLVHLLGAPFVGAFDYAEPLRHASTYLLLVQWVIFPLMAGAGVRMWLGPQLARQHASARDAVRR